MEYMVLALSTARQTVCPLCQIETMDLLRPVSAPYEHQSSHGERLTGTPTDLPIDVPKRSFLTAQVCGAWSTVQAEALKSMPADSQNLSGF